MQLVGTLAKSDGNCYVPRQTSFDRPVDFQRWNYFDYPSLGQVHAKLLENDVILIIAAPAHFQSSYQVNNMVFSHTNAFCLSLHTLINALTVITIVYNRYCNNTGSCGSIDRGLSPSTREWRWRKFPSNHRS